MELGIAADDELSDDELAAVDERAARAVAAGLEAAGRAMLNVLVGSRPDDR